MGGRLPALLRKLSDNRWECDVGELAKAVNHEKPENSIVTMLRYCQ